MRRATLLAFGLMLIDPWSSHVARAQTPAVPPVSLAPPHASLPHASARNSQPKVPPPHAFGEPSASANPAADYDGFSAAVDDSDAPSQLTPPARSGVAKSPTLDSQSLIDQDDEALKRKLTICKNCK